LATWPDLFYLIFPLLSNVSEDEESKKVFSFFFICVPQNVT